MTQNEFYAAVAENILDYMEPQYAGATVTIEERVKNNDMQVHGMSIMKEGDHISPILYLDEFCEEAENGSSFSSILERIASAYAKAVREKPSFELPKLSRENVEEKMRLRVIDFYANKEFVRQHPYIDLGCGYVGTLYIPMDDMIGQKAMVQITNEGFCSLKLGDGIFEKAMKNTKRDNPAVFANLDDMLFGMEEPGLLKNDPNVDPEREMMVLSTPDGYLGATALFYPDTQEEIARILGQNYYVLPSSIHEILILPETTGNYRPEEMVYLVKGINEEQVRPEERLGNRVMYYDREKKELLVAADLDREKTKQEAER